VKEQEEGNDVRAQCLTGESWEKRNKEEVRKAGTLSPQRLFHQTGKKRGEGGGQQRKRPRGGKERRCGWSGDWVRGGGGKRRGGSWEGMEGVIHYSFKGEVLDNPNRRGKEEIGAEGTELGRLGFLWGSRGDSV